MKTFLKNFNGQVSSIDVVLATVIFIMIFVFMRGVWIQNIENAQNEFSFSEMQLKSQQAIDSLVKTGGYPSNWSSSNVELLGLAEKPLVLSSLKVAAFSSFDYNKSRYLLGLGNYDFSIKISSQTPSNSVSFGTAPDINRFVFSIRRVVLYKGEKADVIFNVYSN